MGAVPRREEVPADDSGTVAYEAAMTDSQLLRAVLDDLKGEGSRPASMSNARKTALGKRLRAATGLPLRETTAFLRISRISYEYHCARLGRDRDADIRGAEGEAFASSGSFYGYRRLNAELRRRSVRCSEKRMRRVMTADSLEALHGPQPAPLQLIRLRGRSRRGLEPAA